MPTSLNRYPTDPSAPRLPPYRESMADRLATVRLRIVGEALDHHRNAAGPIALVTNF